MKYVYRYIAIIFFLIAFGLFKLALYSAGYSGLLTLFIWVLAIGFSSAGVLLFRKAKNLRQKKGAEVINSDTRNPIIYLRSFLDDAAASVTQNDGLAAKFLSVGLPQNLNSEEEQISFAVNAFGPMIAIGNPHEHIPQPGAARLYAENTTWKDVVIDLIKNSQLVILRVGETPGFWWEVNTVIQHVSPNKIIFLLPNTFKKYIAFKNKLESQCNITLPEDYNPIIVKGQTFSAVLAFDSTWQSSILYCKEHSVWLFGNGVTSDFREIIQQIKYRRNENTFQQFAKSRSKFQRTFGGQIQMIGGVFIIGLIISSFISGLVEGCGNIKEINAGSPTMIVGWLVASLIVYLLFRWGEKPDKNV